MSHAQKEDTAQAQGAARAHADLTPNTAGKSSTDSNSPHGAAGRGSPGGTLKGSTIITPSTPVTAATRALPGSPAAVLSRASLKNQGSGKGVTAMEGIAEKARARKASAKEGIANKASAKKGTVKQGSPKKGGSKDLASQGIFEKPRHCSCCWISGMHGQF